MKTKNLTVAIDDFQFDKFGFESDYISFDELKEKISIEYAREALLNCNLVAQQAGLSKLTLEEINAEIKAVRDAKNRD
ncbi:MAG: hypothetical protein ABI729_10220 [Chitinophagales bacterium]